MGCGVWVRGVSGVRVLSEEVGCGVRVCGVRVCGVRVCGMWGEGVWDVG